MGKVKVEKTGPAVGPDAAKAKLSAVRIAKLETTRKSILAKLYAAETIEPRLYKTLFPEQGITVWEELVCVGFNPRSSRLEAVVSIKRTSGYSGNLCSEGSMEYIRFFIDWRDGSGFQDAGLAGFKAYDIPDEPGGLRHPWQHMIYVDMDDEARRKCCSRSVLPRACAVLAWNQIPSLDPGETPVFGNRVDADIQIVPKFNLSCLLEDIAVMEIKPELLEMVDADMPLLLKKPLPVPWKKLAQKYRKSGIPDHRLVYDVVGPLVHGTAAAGIAALQPDLGALSELGIDITKLLQILDKDSANTTYEELVCAGLNTAADTLGAVIRVKKPAGYSGTLCQSGSSEYVAFWADWNNSGSFDEHLGTAKVEVHDIPDIPDGGLYYGVFLPVNLTGRLKKCGNPNIVKIRAVLSWAVPPSTSDPEKLNSWGNRLDRLVRLRHVKQPATGLADLLYFIGGVPPENIDPSTHLAYPSGGLLNPANCGQAAKDRPFAGRVSIRGRIYNTGAPESVYYQVQYAPHGTGNWLPVTHQVTYRLAHPDPADPLYPVLVLPVSSADGWFPYQEDPTSLVPILEERALLADWETGAHEGAYDLRLAYTRDYPDLNPVQIKYSDVVVIMIDNTKYAPSLTANQAVDTSSTLDLVIDGGDCHNYNQNSVIKGHLRALDSHFWRWRLDLQPSAHAHGCVPAPRCRSYASLADQGDAGAAWELATKQDGNKMDKCGYTLTLWAYDRAIVDSNGALVHWNRKSVGFSVV